jgi:tetratricopeptide (TPR) repeat protein
MLEAQNDNIGLAEVWFVLANGVYNGRAQGDQMVRAAEQAREYETLARVPHRSDRVQALGLRIGTCPVDRALRRLDALDPSIWVDLTRAVLLAMNDQMEEARALADEAGRHARELGSGIDTWLGHIESLAGNHEAAAEHFGAWYDEMAASGETAGIANVTALEGRELCLLGRYEAAERLAMQARERDDEGPLWRQVAALVKANQGDHKDAEQLAREAVDITREMEAPQLEGHALSDLAEVLAAAGRHGEAMSSLQKALELYQRKGIVPLARRARERLGAMAGEAAQ